MTDEKEVEPMFHVEPKHVKDALDISYSEGTKNLYIRSMGNTPEETMEMLDHAFKKWKEIKDEI